MPIENELSEKFFERLKKIRAFVFDVDGVLTNGQLLLLEDGQWLRQMNIRDGYAIGHAIDMRYNIAIITGSDSVAIQKRLEALGVEDIFMEVDDKHSAIDNFKIRHGLSNEEVLGVGDDIPEVAFLVHCGFTCCPSDAVEEIKKNVDYIIPKPGGCGAVRDIIEMVLTLHGNWPNDIKWHHDKGALHTR